MLIQNLQAVSHKFVIILYVASGQFEFVNPCLFGHVDPNFRYKYAFQIGTYNPHIF